MTVKPFKKFLLGRENTAIAKAIPEFLDNQTLTRSNDAVPSYQSTGLSTSGETLSFAFAANPETLNHTLNATPSIAIITPQSNNVFWLVSATDSQITIQRSGTSGGCSVFIAAGTSD